MAAPHQELFPRFAVEAVSAALLDNPVVLVIGPRQCGKTTLVRNLIAGKREFLTLDDDTVLAAARSDPTSFVRSLDRVTIDEVQRAPELLRAIKRVVDDDRRAGRFLLTGSANIFTLPKVSESLAGRMEIVSLLPFSQGELRGHKPDFLHAAFGGRLRTPRKLLVGEELVQVVLHGGYPEMLRRNPKRQQKWARDYINALVQRDVREIAEVEKLDRMPRLLQTLAHHSGQLTNFAQIGAQAGFDDKTTNKYVGILERLFLVRRIQPWFRNRLKRLIKTPKLHFLDSGLLSAELGVSAGQVVKNRSLLGPLLETFVFSEVLKQSSWFDEDCVLHHYRDKDQDEVDLVVEAANDAMLGLEVKAGATVYAQDFKGLRKLAAASGAKFKLGVVLYDGDRVVNFGERLVAAPISCLWE